MLWIKYPRQAQSLARPSVLLASLSFRAVHQVKQDGREGARMAQPCPSRQVGCPAGPRKQEWVGVGGGDVSSARWAGALTHLRSPG